MNKRTTVVLSLKRNTVMAQLAIADAQGTGQQQPSGHQQLLQAEKICRPGQQGSTSPPLPGMESAWPHTQPWWSPPESESHGDICSIQGKRLYQSPPRSPGFSAGQAVTLASPPEAVPGGPAARRQPLPAHTPPESRVWGYKSAPPGAPGLLCVSNSNVLVDTHISEQVGDSQTRERGTPHARCSCCLLWAAVPALGFR